ncbi:hypothetical protein BgiBS90_037090 [Biomphalaria glabrata]|nr:hypothetical protein BgiBS90_037090 [Biomphalaria glabrata]
MGVRSVDSKGLRGHQISMSMDFTTVCVCSGVWGVTFNFNVPGLNGCVRLFRRLGRNLGCVFMAYNMVVGSNLGVIGCLCSTLVSLVLRHHYIRAPLRHSTTTSEHHYVTAPLHQSTITSHHHYIRAPLRHSTTTSEHHYVTAPLHQSTITSQHHYVRAPLRHSTTTSEHHYVTAPLRQSTITSQRHYIRAPLRHSTTTSEHHYD